MIRTLSVTSEGQGLHEITSRVSATLEACLGECGVTEGLLTLYLQHTSASLVVQENADPSVRRDLEAWLNRLVPEHDPLYTHTVEGPDDMPAHIKGALTATSLSLPVIEGRLALGTWQGVFLWEHRHAGGRRKLVLHLS